MGRAAGLSKAQRRALAELRPPLGAKVYLAEGSAVAHHLGHRRSRDLDLFSRAAELDLETVSRVIVASTNESVEVISRTDAALHVRLGTTALDIVCYPYQLLEEPREGPEDFPTAQLADLAAMKVSAIASRGIRRDFWDLWAMCAPERGLAWALDAYERRFSAVSVNRYHVLRAMTYFDDAESTRRMPAGLDAALWRRIRDYFEREVPALLLQDQE